MNLKEAFALAHMHKAPTPNFVDPFQGLSDDLLAELRAILAPAVNANLWLESDPVAKAAIGVGLAGGIYRIALVTAQDGTQRPAILNPAMQEISTEEFHTLINALYPPGEVAQVVVPEIPQAAHRPVPASLRQLEVLQDIRALLTEIRDRLP